MKVGDDIELKFYQVLKRKINIQDFELWIYDTEELENRLPNDLYIDLISMNYKSKYALEDLSLLIEKYVDFGKFETNKIKDLLKSIIDRDKKCSESIAMTYDLYCKGYNFLRRLGLKYGLMVVCPPVGDYHKTWNEISFEEQNKLLDMFYPEIIIDAKNALAWFEAKKIIIKSTVDEAGRYEYDDFRNREEKEQGDIEAVNLDNKNKTIKPGKKTKGFWAILISRMK